MPIIASRGAMSSTGFGEFAKSASGYTFIAQTQSNTLYGTKATENLESATWSLITPAPQSYDLTLANPPFAQGGIVSDGVSIATKWQVSRNNSAWSSWYGGVNFAAVDSLGVNGTIAYNPTAKIAGSVGTISTKAGLEQSSAFTSLVTNASTSQVAAISGSFKNIVYCPAVNRFYACYTGSSIIQIFDGTSAAALGTQNLGINLVYLISVSEDGYLLVDSRGSGTARILSKYTNADLSSFVTLGNYSTGYTTGGAWVWQQSTGTYIKGLFNTSSPVVQFIVFNPTTGTFSTSNTLNTSSNGVIRTQLFFSGSKMYFTAVVFFIDKGITYAARSYYSADGGASWSNFLVNSGFIISICSAL